MVAPNIKYLHNIAFNKGGRAVQDGAASSRSWRIIRARHFTGRPGARFGKLVQDVLIFLVKNVYREHAAPVNQAVCI